MGDIADHFMNEFYDLWHHLNKRNEKRKHNDLMSFETAHIFEGGIPMIDRFILHIAPPATSEKDQSGVITITRFNYEWSIAFQSNDRQLNNMFWKVHQSISRKTTLVCLTKIEMDLTNLNFPCQFPCKTNETWVVNTTKDGMVREANWEKIVIDCLEQYESLVATTDPKLARGTFSTDINTIIEKFKQIHAWPKTL